MGKNAKREIENVGYQNIITGCDVSVPKKHYDFSLNMAACVATKSKDEFSKVGCVVTDENFVIISTGYNGPNRMARDMCFNFTRTPKLKVLQNRYPHLDLDFSTLNLEKNTMMIHAEINALVNCTNKNSMKDSIVFVTHYTCVNCLNTLIQAGVKRIVVEDNKHSAFKDTLPQLLYLLENSSVPEDFFLVHKN